MLGVIALGLCIGLSSPESTDFEFDLFLVANNSTIVSDLDWLQSDVPVSGIRQVLAPALKSLYDKKTMFMLVDGGDCVPFADTKPKERIATVVDCQFKVGGRSMETVSKNGKTTVVATEATTYACVSASTIPRVPLAEQWGTAAFYVRPEGKEEYLIVLDLRYYRTAHNQQTSLPSDRRGRTLVISGEDFSTTASVIRDQLPDFDGVCVANWGAPRDGKSNIISFPPAGVVTHYKLFRKNAKMGVKLVEYLRSRSVGANRTNAS